MMPRITRSWRALARRAAVLAILCTFALVSLSCSGPSVSAFGEINDVVVLFGKNAAGAPAELLKDALTAKSQWLVGESLFQVNFVPVSDINDYTFRRHIIILGTWDDRETARIVNSRIGGLAPGDGPGMHAVEDIWGEGQVVMAVMADSRSELEGYLQAGASDIARELVLDARARLARKLRQELESTGFDKEMDDRFGWSLGPPAGYDLFPANEAEGLVFFRKTAPDRTMYVYWQEGSPDDVTAEFLTAARNEIGARYFDGDAIEQRRELTIERVEFEGMPALQMSGWWGNRELVGGGPFRSYCFYVPAQGRTYVLDAAVFAPELEKTPLMRNLDATLHTFRAATSQT